MKTTLEIPDELYREVKIMAARRGLAIKEVIQEALVEKLSREDRSLIHESLWTKSFGKLKHLKKENARILALIESECERMDPENSL